MSQAIEWEEPACLICGGVQRIASDSVTWRGVEFRYVLCRICGLKQMCPRPTQRWYHAFYEREFWQEKIEYRGFSQAKAQRQRPADAGLQRRLSKQHWRAERIVRLAGRSVTPTAQSLAVDVGTAFGVTLHLLRERFGCRVAGVEPSAVARDYAEREFAITFVGRYIEDLFEPTALDGTVTLLVFSQVLENVVDPRAALHAARRLLAPDGFLYIDTSNFFYYNAINPYHPYVFSPATLEDLLGQTGFTVVDREHAPPPTESAAPAEPPDRYLMFMSTPGASPFTRGIVDVEQLVAEQRRGLEWVEAAKAGRKAARSV